MPAYFETGFSVRERMWHGLGIIREDYPGSWDEVRRDGGFEWDPVEQGVYEVDELYADGRATVKLIDDFKQVKRSDTGARLAIAADGYELIPHDVMGEIFEAIMDKSTGLMKFETAGVLEGGKKVWALARLGGEIELPGDPSPLQPYIAVLNSHDGSAALRVIATAVRIVCWNTWHAADMQATANGSAYSFKHTKNWQQRVNEAKAALTGTQAQIDYTVQQAKELLAVKVNKAQRELFIRDFAVHRVISTTVGKRKMTKKSLEDRLAQPQVQACIDDVLRQVTARLDSSTCAGIRDTAWGLIQAAGEFADHDRKTVSTETYFSRTMINKEPLKLAAVRIAREAATVG